MISPLWGGILVTAPRLHKLFVERSRDESLLCICTPRLRSGYSTRLRSGYSTRLRSGYSTRLRSGYTRLRSGYRHSASLGVQTSASLGVQTQQPHRGDIIVTVSPQYLHTLFHMCAYKIGFGNNGIITHKNGFCSGMFSCLCIGDAIADHPRRR